MGSNEMNPLKIWKKLWQSYKYRFAKSIEEMPIPVQMSCELQNKKTFYTPVF